MNQPPSHGHTQRSQFACSLMLCAGLGRLFLSLFLLPSLSPPSRCLSSLRSVLLSIVVWCHSISYFFYIHVMFIVDPAMTFEIVFLLYKIIHWFPTVTAHIIFFVIFFSIFFFFTHLRRDERETKTRMPSQICGYKLFFRDEKLMFIWNVNCTDEGNNNHKRERNKKHEDEIELNKHIIATRLFSIFTFPYHTLYLEQVIT